ncbi:hypothetical protein RJT34_28640 [Clitoria ternatea]|uniref:B box-type domain-containing protein n=1 Tax=Clitoria ternatea TaxID=43366 RepID=A0AAN9FHX5_CLITE
MFVTAWLEKLLSITTFFSACTLHAERPKSECNTYCIDCSEEFCYHCGLSSHKDHRQIQIRKSSHHEAVREEDIKKELDSNGVQTYVINSSRVIFLNKRRHNHPNSQKRGKNCSYRSQCKICSRNLMEPFRFCSLGCKLAWVKSESGSNVTRVKEEATEEKGITRTEPSKEDIELKDQDSKPVYESMVSSHNAQSIPKVIGFRSKRRKGIPHRAPFF